MNTAPLPPPILHRSIAPGELDAFAPVDPKVRVWSRFAILQIAARMLDATRRCGEPFALALLSIQPLQEVRDLRGHSAADMVMREAAARVRGVLGATDSIGRYTNDDMLVVLPRCTQDALLGAAERIRHAVSCAPMHAADLAIDATASIGATMSDGTHEDLDALVIAADVALHRAKRGGGSAIEMRWPSATFRLAAIEG